MLSRRIMLSRGLGALSALAAGPLILGSASAQAPGGPQRPWDMRATRRERESFPLTMPVLRAPDPQAPRASAWSACLEMVCAAYSRHVPATQILQTAFVEAWPRPGDNAAAADSVSRGWTDTRGRPLTVMAELVWQNPRGLQDRSWAGAAAAAWQLRRGRPVLAEFGSHMMVLTDLVYDRLPGSGRLQVVEAVIQDPMPADGSPAARYAIGPREWQRLTALVGVDVADDPPPPLARAPYRRPPRSGRRPLPRPGGWRDVPIRW